MKKPDARSRFDRSSDGARPLDPDMEFYSIGQAADATGISSETLRIWERRYGKPEPIRRPSGHRRYTREQVIWLRQIGELIARGHRPGIVVRMDPEEMARLLEERPAAQPSNAEAIEMVDLIQKFDGETFVERMREASRKYPPTQFLLKFIAPVSEEVGRRWADGKLEIRHEHYATGLMEDYLRMLRSQFVTYPYGPRVLLTTMSGETHSLGLQMAALLCAAEGVFHRVLGIDTPNPEIVAAAREANVQAVGVSVSLATSGPETDRQIADLREDLPMDTMLVVGGMGARGIRRGPRNVTYIESLEDWVRWLRTLRTEWQAQRRA